MEIYFLQAYFQHTHKGLSTEVKALRNLRMLGSSQSNI